MSYYGDIRLGDSLDIKFTTRQISGAPTTLAGSPVISAYPANSLTQLTAGITLSVDFDTLTGLNNIRVVASGGNGYLTATNYELVITTGTVNSVSVVGECVGGFSIENRSALMPATAARTLVVDAAGLADANVVKLGPSGSGTAQTARDVGASVLLSAGAGAGQLDFTAGVVKANLAQILGTALTETAGQIAAAFKKFFNIATPASTMDALTLVATATAVTTVNGLANNVITAASINADAITAAKIADGAIDAATFAAGAINAAAIAADAITDAKVAADVTIASVTGAVGSVTAAVTVGTNNDKTGYGLTAAYDPAKTAAQAGDAMSLTTAVRPGIRKNTALANFEILMTDSTNHAPVTGKAVTVTRSIDGGAFAGGTLGAVTELSNGIYKFDFAAGDLNGDVVTLRAIAAGSDDLFLTIRTTP